MKNAVFSLTSYKFEKVEINASNVPTEKISVDFNPRGEFNTTDHTFKVTLDFYVFQKELGVDNYFVMISCSSIFQLESVSSIEEVPNYFYKNSIAIVYPYIRAFVSSVTVQANIRPIILPTLNLSSLETPLKDNTIVVS
ncbi:MAG: hypothetical protein A3D31_12820 [Candidatus Fluviicola riflensis]|nr:MAG: hypothetical protein CHH17_17260 [Candidatus Fluviicola riflensis]OGS77866.1 MAG: hypothetical protein A3D31_12820 [Candidatus Fluviicola riflensis]OGS84931.1 MAG: hypothetical protein A2724_09755 [Fluviicola sp. RIFCSPHIGHO2_01_FULL_43_53]OGS89203.1 MAG: hypothetical protein A3E30_04060 [Fluviicola sp. RIFCSPHIGHO2_12_FULL_43_24]